MYNIFLIETTGEVFITDTSLTLRLAKRLCKQSNGTWGSNKLLKNSTFPLAQIDFYVYSDKHEKDGEVTLTLKEAKKLLKEQIKLY